MNRKVSKPLEKIFLDCLGDERGEMTLREFSDLLQKDIQGLYYICFCILTKGKVFALLLESPQLSFLKFLIHLSVYDSLPYKDIFK